MSTSGVPVSLSSRPNDGPAQDRPSGGATPAPVVLVGFTYVSLLAVGVFQPDRSVIVVEEPDVVRARGLRVRARSVPVILELVEWPYRREGAAEEFLAARPDLRPAAIGPTGEYATIFAARLAELHGLPGAGHGAARLLRDKSLLREATRYAGVAHPESGAVDAPADVKAFMAAGCSAVVLKPADRQGSLGTRILHSPGEIDGAWAESVAECAAERGGVPAADRAVPVRMMVERYVGGAPFSVEMLVSAGRVVFGNVTKKALFPGPRPIERGQLVPAGIPSALDSLLREQTERVVAATGFGTGAVHCEWIVEDGTPYLIECAGRLPGDSIVDLIEWAYDIELVRAYWTLLRGDQLATPLRRRAGKAAAVRFAHAEPGVVDSVEGLAQAYAVPDVIRCEVLVEPGSRVEALRSSMDRSAFAISCAATPTDAVRRAEEAIGRLRITTRPSSVPPAPTAPGTSLEDDHHGS